MITISGRIDKELLKEIEKIAKEKGLDRSAVLREALKLWIMEKKMEKALALLRERKITVWKAAQIAGTTYREILNKLRKENIPFPLSVEELKVELEEIRRK